MTPIKTMWLARFNHTVTIYNNGVITDEGNAFRLLGDTLVNAPLNADRTIETSGGEINWGEVDFYSIEDEDAMYCAALETVLISIRGMF